MSLDSATADLAALSRRLDLEDRAGLLETVLCERPELEDAARTLLGTMPASEAATVPVLPAPPRPLGLAPGDVLGGFRITGTLGHGGFGSVYRAESVSTGTVVALKTLRVRRPRALEGLAREVHALARLCHPGIVRVVADGVADGVPFYAMEALDGRSLRSALPLPIREALAVARALCAPLAYLHGEGIVHRDLKPDNVVIRHETGLPCLVDLGLASQFARAGHGETLELSELGGTVGYMAPEQVRGELLDARADLYALGCLLYELLTGRPPFVADLPAAVLWRHLTDVPGPPSRFVAGIPSELDQLVLTLLEKEPRERLGYAEDLDRALATLGAAAPGWRDAPPPRLYLYRPRLHDRNGLLGTIEARLPATGQPGGAMLVRGDAGAGKTRLLLEVAHRARDAGITVVAGAVQDADLPLGAFRPLLRAVADRCEEMGPGEVARLLGEHGALLAAYEPTLRSLLPAGTHLEPPELPHDASVLRVADAIADLCGSMALHGPLLLVVDDVHRADDLSRSCLEHVVRRLDGTAPLGLLLAASTSGPAQTLAASAPHLGAVIDLERLSTSGVHAMIADMLALPEIPEDLGDLLARHAEGNPFFVTEYLQTAVAQGLLRRDGAGRWHLRDPDELLDRATLSLPDSLRELAARRLETVDGDAARLMSAAAILGREAPLLIAAHVAGIADEDASATLRDLAARGVVEPRGDVVRFQHEGILEEAYSRIDSATRGALHRAAALRIEQALPEERSAQAAALARHWTGAGEPGKVGPYYLAGARHAVAHHAPALAEGLYRRYLELAPPGPERVAARNELGRDALHLQGRRADALATHEEALAEARELDDRRGEAESLLCLGRVQSVTCDGTDARRSYEEALVLARAEGDERLQANVHGSLATLLRTLGDLDGADAHYQRAKELARSLGNVLHLGRLQALQGNVAVARGDHARSRSLFEAAMETARSVGDVQGEGIALNNLAVQAELQGDRERARDLYARSRDLAHRAGARQSEAIALSNLAGVLPDEREATRLYEQALRMFRAAGDRRWEARTTGNMGLMYMEHGRLDEAEAALRSAVASYRALGDREGLAAYLGDLVEIALQREGRLADAVACAREAEQLWRDLGRPHHVAAALCRRGLVDLRRSDAAGARARLAEAEHLVAALPAPPAADLTQSLEKLRAELDPPGLSG